MMQFTAAIVVFGQHKWGNYVSSTRRDAGLAAQGITTFRVDHATVPGMVATSLSHQTLARNISVPDSVVTWTTSNEPKRRHSSVFPMTLPAGMMFKMLAMRNLVVLRCSQF
jgi:hypothetical protein